MKRIFFALFITIYTFYIADAQTNIYANLNSVTPAPPGNAIIGESINSIAYAPLRSSFGSDNFAYVSAHATYNYNDYPSVVLKFVNYNLNRYYENSPNPHTIVFNTSPITTGSSVTANEVLHSSKGYIAFCGALGDQAYIGTSSQIVYRYSVAYEFYSMVEVPGTGYAACGWNGTKGIILLVDYTFNILTYYECSAFLSQVIFDQTNSRLVFCGMDPTNSKICVFYNSVSSLLSGTYSTQGFSFSPSSFGIDDRKNIRMVLLDNNRVAIAASGHANNPANPNVTYNGILHINKLDGTSGTTHIFNINSDKFHFRDIQTFDQENFYMLFWHNASPSVPVIIQAAAGTSSRGTWSGILVNRNPLGSSSTVEYNRMFKRTMCDRLEIAGFENLYTYSTPRTVLSTNHYASVQTPLASGTLWGFETAISTVYHTTLPTSISAVPSITSGSRTSRTAYPVNPPSAPVITFPPRIYSNGENQSWCFKSMSENISDNMIAEATENISASEAVRFTEEKATISNMEAYLEYTVFDMMGRQTLNGRITKNDIDLSSLPKGMYILRLAKNNGEYEQHKFIAK